MENENRRGLTSCTTAKVKSKDPVPLRKTVLMERERLLPPGNENVRVIDLFGLPLTVNLTFVQFYEMPEAEHLNQFMEQFFPNASPWDHAPSGAAYVGPIEDPNQMSGVSFHAALLCCRAPTHHPEWYSIISHEACHIAESIMTSRGMVDCDEFRCWMSDWIVQAYLRYFLPSLPLETATDCV